jgi:hypothetical protein
VDFVCLYFSNWINSLGEQSLNLYSKVYSFSTVKKLYLIHWLQSCPQLPRILEIVGLGYTIWFSSRYLLFKVCPYLLLSNDTRHCRLRIHHMPSTQYCVLYYVQLLTVCLTACHSQENRDELFAKAYDLKLKIIGSDDAWFGVHMVGLRCIFLSLCNK